MEINYKKFWRWIGWLLAMIIVLGGIFYWQNYLRDNNKLRVTVFDVGQGDSILIQTPSRQDILIDGGPDNRVLNSLGRAMPFFDKTIDLVVLTHPHADHLNGLIEVLRRYKVKEVMYYDPGAGDAGFQEFKSEIKDEKIIIDSPFIGEVLNFGGVKMTVVGPPNLKTGAPPDDNLNNNSIVLRLDYGQEKFLFTGDAEIEEENKILALGEDVDADVIKVGHHGSKTSSGDEFLAAVTPEIAAISVGKNNSFKHPSLRTVARIERTGARVYRTDEVGDIRLASDGSGIWLAN